MTFLNPLMLAALAAASIPLLLHLLNRRKGGTIEIPTLRFLTEMQTTRLRSIRIRRLLLLLLRLGVVIFTVLGFAGPVLSDASSGLLDPGSDPVVILLDDSWSMQAGEEGALRWERGIEVARELIGAMEQNRRYALIPLSSAGSALEVGLRRDRLAGEEMLDDLRPSYAPLRYRDGLAAAHRLLGSGRGDVVLISDLEENNLFDLDELTLRFSPETTLHVIEPVVEPRGGTNISIDTVRFLTQIPEPGKEFVLEATVRVDGERTTSAAEVTLWIDGRREESVAIDPKRSGQVVLLHGRPAGTGAIGAFLEVSGDDILQDNRYYFGLDLVDNIRVAVIAEAGEQSVLDKVIGLSGIFSPRSFSEARPPVFSDGQYATLLLVDPSDRMSQSEQIATYVKGGGGLVLFAGPRLEQSRTTGGLLDQLGVSAERSARASLSSDSIVVSRIERSHPLFEGVFDKDRSGRIDDLVVRRTLSARSGESLVTLASGEALVSDISFGEGRVIYIAVPPTSEWSTLERSSLFVPLIIRSLLYTAASGGIERVYRAGDVPRVRASRFGRSGDSGTLLSVRQPSGEVYSQELIASGENSTVALRPLEGSGLLEVSIAGQREALYGVNGDPTESRGGVASREALRSALLPLVESESRLLFESDASIAPDRSGIELWQIALLIAIACAIAELIVGRGTGENRAGDQESVLS